MPSTSFPIPGSTAQPIAKELYCSDAKAISEVSFRLASNDSILFHMLTGMRPAANGIIPSLDFGHQHRGGESGAPIPRVIAGCPQSENYLWSVTAGAGTTVAFNSDATVFSIDAPDFWFYVPHGIDKVNIYTCISTSGGDASGGGKIRWRIGSTNYDQAIGSGGMPTFTRKWNGEQAINYDTLTDVKVQPNGWYSVQAYFVNDMTSAATIIVYGWFVKEATTIT